MNKPAFPIVAGLLLFFLAIPRLGKAAYYSDSLKNLSITWTSPIEIAIPEHGKIKSLNHEGAIHDPGLDYLPSLRVKLKHVWVDSVALEIKETGDFSNGELQILQRVFQPGRPLHRISNFMEDSEMISEIDVVPVDTSAALPGKIIRFNLVYFFSNPPKTKTTYTVYKNEYRNSALAEGEWFKLAVVKDGVYKITASWIKKTGLSPAHIDPATIRIFGNGGGALPQSNQAPRPKDLIENAIATVGMDDGRFDDGDYVLFYGQGPHKLAYDAQEGKIKYENNPYCDTSYYFLNVGLKKGKRIGSAKNIPGDHVVRDAFDQLLFHERNEHNLLNADPFKSYGGSGRIWFGERFSIVQREATIEFDAPGLIPGSAIQLVSSLVSGSKNAAEYALQAGGQTVGQQVLDPAPQGEYSEKAAFSVDTFRISSIQPPPGGKLKVSIVYKNPQDSRSIGYLDYLLLHAKRELALYGDQTSFFSIASLNSGVSTFRIKCGRPSPLIWNISNPFEPLNQEFKTENGFVSFSASTNPLQNYVVFDPESDLLAPIYVGRVPNQNLQGEQTPNLLIVTHPAFLAQAEKLANLRRSHDGYSVLTATVDQIYNEFSSGSQDVTAIRDFIKYFYDRNGGNLKYVLLFGKGTFDYRNKLGHDLNFVPTYQSRNSSHPIYSYSSDDYFGFLDDNEGEWEENMAGDHLMDIGVGRLPVTTAEEAEIAVKKLEHYALNSAAFGDWRKEIYFIADDEDGNSHQMDSENLAALIESNYPQFNVNKIYLDAYPQIANPAERSPAAKRAIEEMIEKGALIVNFTGHGNTDQWTEEQILTIVDINRWKNIHRLPLFVTATCQFGRHDNPAKRSGSEYMLFNKNGGAIALVTTGRPVYASSNFHLNRAFYQAVFEMAESGNPALGDVFRRAKNNSLQGPNNRNFSLLGDPSMKLAYPGRKIQIEAIKTAPEGALTDTLKALQRVRIEGTVINQGAIDENFTGMLYATLYDKESTLKTLGNKSAPMFYKQWDNVIFNGQAAVRNGRFAFEFIVPKNIAYDLSKGKLSMYAHDKNFTADAAGAAVDIKVGGSAVSPPVDNKPPEITLYIADTLFKDGGFTGPDARLIARLSDESGINISGRGIGQDIKLSLDHGEEISINSFYRSDPDDFTKGWALYPLRNLEPGEHVATLKARDVYNNPAEASVRFYVGSKENLELRNVVCAPNPFSRSGLISFEHNRPGEGLDIEASIYDISGKMIGSFHFEKKESGSVVYLFNWEGRDASGKKLETGIYIFKIFVRSLEDGSTCSHSIKLSLIN